MDIELFQWVLLGLLALGIIVLVALLATLGGIKKALEQRASTPTSAPEASAPAAAAEASAEQPAAQLEEEDTSGAGTSPSATAAATASSGQAGSIRSVLEQHGLSETASRSTEDAATAEPEDTGVADSVFAAHADDPQEEPFQRDGRWWFRRGDELLLYDEASGQWQPAPQGADEEAGAPAAGTGATASGGGTATDTAVQTTPVSAQPAVSDEVATFWKCPTCGAVNGSTAATCRMCFAARP